MTCSPPPLYNIAFPSPCDSLTRRERRDLSSRDRVLAPFPLFPVLERTASPSFLFLLFLPEWRATKALPRDGPETREADRTFPSPFLLLFPLAKMSDENSHFLWVRRGKGSKLSYLLSLFFFPATERRHKRVWLFCFFPRHRSFGSKLERLVSISSPLPSFFSLYEKKGFPLVTMTRTVEVQVDLKKEIGFLRPSSSDESVCMRLPISDA